MKKPRFLCLLQLMRIEEKRQYENALGSKVFLLLNANMDAKVFWERYDIAGLI